MNEDVKLLSLPFSTGEAEQPLAVRLVLQLALTPEKRQWVRRMCRERHYLLPPLTDGQRRHVLEISRLDKPARRKRLATLLPAQQGVLFLVSWPRQVAA